MKRHFALAVILALVLAIVPLGSSSSWAVLSEIDVSWRVDQGVMLSEQIEESATNVGLTWEGERPQRAWFRVKEDGRWSAWISLPMEEDHGPDPGTEEASHSKPASDLVWVGPVDAVQYQIEGGTKDTKAVLIDTTDRTKPLSQQFNNLFNDPTADAATAAPGQPTIRPRSAWDPSGSCTPKTEPGLVQVTLAFVHHTTGSNSYSQAEVPSRILGICLFHTNTRGWDDIGYNFLIDRFGVIWEGRAGGIGNGVQGAHTAGFNSYSTGVAFLGDHTSSAPTAAAEAALVDLLAWKFGVHNVEPRAFNTVVSKGSAKWPVGYPVAFHPISGHRDAQATSCPGEACHRRLPSFRSRVDAAWSQIPLSRYRSPMEADFDGDGEGEGAVFKTTNGTWQVTQQSGSTSTWADYSTASGWRAQTPGDFDGDDRDDIANFHPGNGTWWVSRSTGSSFSTELWADYSTASGWSSQVVGDFDGDGRDDIANFHPGNGTWWVSRSTGSSFSTGLWANYSTNTGWTSQIVGDFNGDGRDDIANRHDASGNWWVSLSTGSSFQTGFWGTATSLDSLSLVWAQDVNADGDDDILAVDAYNGFVRRHLSSGSSFSISTLVDAPWRTTVGRAQARPSDETTAVFFFGQEFQWVRLTGLHQGSAGAQVIATLPRS